VGRFGGFLDDPEMFDAGFFGIAPREAVMMDPQHRLALEVAWEALENAGYASAAMQGSATGIFLGIGNSDYGRHIFRDAEAMDAYAGSGNSAAMVAGRLAYVLGLHGPALAIDTSCSSSLVAVHEACASLRVGECTMALAGGVNLMLLPEAHVALSRSQMMAPDGHCKTFDDAADGYVRGEGGGVVVLKKVSAAIADGDRILAVIRGSAVNHDGRSGGLTAPSGPAQAAVIREALEAARVRPAEIGFVETHGTGTALGDPIEVEALASVLGGRDPREPLLLGALKTNLGHLEAASGIAGLIKAVLVLQHGVVPANLHLKKKNTRIPWDRLSVKVPEENTPWHGRYAGVSSFGFSGTNAHVILERSPEQRVEENALDRPWHVLALSAKSETGLERLRARYASALREENVRVADICFTANTGRSHFEKRCAVVAQTADAMATGLEGSAAVQCWMGTADGEPGRIGFLFTGQGSQYAGMGQELYESSAVYREAVERCSAVWQEQTGVSLREALNGRGDLKEARIVQPALFSLEYGLAQLWRSWGIEPALVLGHSLGEYVAGVVAGLLTLEDGLRLVHARSELMDRLAVHGGMRAVAADAERVRETLGGWEKQVSIAAINGPASVVISGSVEGLREVAGRLEADGVRTRELEVSHAFHSPLLEPILDEFEERAGKVAYGNPRVRMISNLTGRVAAAGEMGRARYWREQMRQTVQFDAGLKAAQDAGCATFIEVGPQPHLRAIAAKTDARLADRIRISMTRNGSAYAQMCESLAQLYVDGQPVNWAGVDRGYRRSRVALPNYPFERQRYWQGPTAVEIARLVWQGASEGAKTQSQFVPMGMRVETFSEKWGALKRLTVAQMLATLGELGILNWPRVDDPDSMLAEAGVVSAHRRLMGRWLALLADEGYLSWSGARIAIPAEIHAPDLQVAWKEAEEQLHDDPYLLAYLRNCAGLLRSVLLGQVRNPRQRDMPTRSSPRQRGRQPALCRRGGSCASSKLAGGRARRRPAFSRACQPATFRIGLPMCRSSSCSGLRRDLRAARFFAMDCWILRTKLICGLIGNRAMC
jgi:acyl transferase domain-containing protein